jgi:hypothetical protein
MLKTILVYVIVLFILIIIARIISLVSRPIINDTKPQFNNFNDYMTVVYCPNKKCGVYNPYPKELIVYKNPKITFDNIAKLDLNKQDKEINIMNTLRYFNYIYDNAPRCILDNYPIAENLSFSWPPKLGSRYKLTAFPYPKSSFILSAVFNTISNTVDAYTFPGWMIQRRNPLDFNNSIFNNNYFRSYQHIEVIHACYPPPGQKWPVCDDGGYWLYLSTGSGVFWNTGKCFVSLNKLSLLYDLYNCSLKLKREYKHNKLIKKQPEIVGLSIQDMVNRLEGKGGGNSIMIAIFSIVNSLTKHEFQAKIVGFKSLAPSDCGKAAWDNFISRSFLITYLITVLIIQFIINIKNKSPKQVILIILTFLIMLALLIYIYLFIIGEDFFRGLGWMTLDIALKETNMTLYQFVEECVLGTQKNPICNSLAMTQIFDLETEYYTWKLGYESFILTSQPNKTGTWEVEICDLRNFDPKNTVIAGGVCGTYHGTGNKYSSEEIIPYDKCRNKLLKRPKHQLILKSGPIELDTTGPPFYKPTKECDCVEGSDRLCVSCKNYLSETLCINK